MPAPATGAAARRACLALAALIGVAGSAAAQSAGGIIATGSVLAGCRALVENAPTGDMMQVGACAGAVSAVLDVSRSLRRVCPPPGGGVLDAARIVIMFVDERPERKADQFGPLALMALGDRWPC
jgi:Ssp1 endopeptidase immunity protein Rap1a